MKKRSNSLVRCVVAGVLVAVLAAFFVYAQDYFPFVDVSGPDWKYNVTPGQMVCYGGVIPGELDAPITIDGNPIQPNDILGVFCDKELVPADNSVNDFCIGAKKVETAGVVPFFSAFGDFADTEFVKEGASPLENIRFKIWDASEERILYATVLSGNTAWADKAKRAFSLAAVSGISADIAGTPKNDFIGGPVYGAAKLGLKPSTGYPVFVVADKNNWANGDTIPARASGSATSFTTGTVGEMPAGTVLYSAPLAGSYDIVVDVNSNGTYDTAADFLDDNVQVGFTVTNPKITATWEPANGGTIEPAMAEVLPGGSKKFDILPNECYNIKNVVINKGTPDEQSLGPVSSYTFTNVQKDQTIYAVFEIKTFTITHTAGANGTITPASPVTVNCGSDKTFTITPSKCFAIATFLVDGVSKLGDVKIDEDTRVGTYELKNIKKDYNLEATFSPAGPFTVTVSITGDGTATPPGPLTKDCASSQVFTFTPGADHHIDDVLVDDVSVMNDVVIDGETGVGTYTLEDITKALEIHVIFELNSHTIAVSAGPHGSIAPPGPEVIVMHGEDQTFIIDPDDCYHIADALLDGNSVLGDVDIDPETGVGTYILVSVAEDHELVVSFAINVYTITAVQTSNGTIAPSSAQVECGSSKAFTITPDDCYRISDVLIREVEADLGAAITVDGGWVSVKNDVQIDPNDVGTYTFVNVRNNYEIKAIFELKTFIITVSAGANGSISPDPADHKVVVNCGADQAFSITANDCYEIENVVVDGTNKGAITSHTFTNVRETHTISATFKMKTYIITVFAGMNGSISPDPADHKVIVNCGANQKFDITPNDCYEIEKVVVVEGGQTKDLGVVTTYTFNNVRQDGSISAAFKIKKYTITVSAGANGSISPDPADHKVIVNCGANQKFDMLSNDCYEVEKVIVVEGGQTKDLGAVTTYTFNNVRQDGSISATFKLKTFIITVSAGANGSIAPDPADHKVVVNCGANQAFSITPNDCYDIDSVVVDGANKGAIASYTFTNVRETHTISATFKIKKYTITVSAGANGSITPPGPSVVVNCGTNQKFDITPSDCYEIVDVVVDSVSKGAISTYTFTNVRETHTIAATFRLKTYIITVSAGANGSITPDPADHKVVVNCGANQAFSITANDCYEIENVVVDGTNKGAIASYTFTNVRETHTIAATFKLKTFIITVSAGANGSITPPGPSVVVNCGADQKFDITPSDCYEIVDVVVDSVSKGAISTYTFTNVRETHTIAATFKLKTFIITVSAGANGSITPDPVDHEVVVNCGANQAFSITPGDCYDIGDVVVDGTSRGPIPSFTFGNVREAHSISATFKVKTYTIKATYGSNGRIDPSGNVQVKCGSDQTFTMMPDPIYHVDEVLVDGVSVGAVPEHTFKSVKADHKIHVTFEIDPVHLMSASYDVLETLLKLTFDRPVKITEPDVPCFDLIGMEVGDSGKMDFALSSNADQDLKNHIWTSYGNRRIVFIDINRAHATTVNLAAAAFLKDKDGYYHGDDIDLLLGPEAFVAIDGAKSAKADVPLVMTANGYILGIKGDLDGSGTLSPYDAAIMLSVSVNGISEAPIYETTVQIGKQYGFKCDIAEYMADWNGDGSITANDASLMLRSLAGLASQAPDQITGAKTARLSVNDYKDGKLDVSIDLDNVSGVYSADIVVDYDPNVLTVADVSKAYSTSEWLSADAAESGKLKIAMAGVSQPVADGSLVKMTFDAASVDAIKQLSIAEFKLNGGVFKITVQNLPKAFALMQNYPNPFNPETWIPYQLSGPADVTVSIYNVNGQMVRRLELGSRMPGHYVDKSRAAYWDGRNESGERVSSGIYFYQLQAGRDSSVRKMIVVK